MFTDCFIRSFYYLGIHANKIQKEFYILHHCAFKKINIIDVSCS